ncbi:MAG: peptidase domain-containing protein [Methanoregula sp.]|jgi:hypothetical protein
MSKRLGIVALVLLVMASCAVVSASELKSVNSGTIILPGNTTGSGQIHPLTVTGSVTQGQTTWQTRAVSSYITSMNVNLYWGVPANSLRLKIYSPDGSIYGPFYDNFDGATDGSINVDVINSGGIPQGTWIYEVYGYSVTGRQYYTI